MEHEYFQNLSICYLKDSFAGEQRRMVRNQLQKIKDLLLSISLQHICSYHELLNSWWGPCRLEPILAAKAKENPAFDLLKVDIHSFNDLA